MKIDNYGQIPGCTMYAALSLISGKWKGMILYHLLKGTLRFNALKRQLGDCSQRLLIKQLRELEEDGLIPVLSSLWFLRALTIRSLQRGVLWSQS